MSLTNEMMEREAELARLAAGNGAAIHAVYESPLALQIRAAVTKRVEPFEVEVAEREYGQSVIVGVVGIKRVFGYRRFMPDGTRNLHTPESFAASVAKEVQADAGRMLEAHMKRQAKAAKRARSAG